MINNVVLVGRLTKNPELRYSSSNIPMVYFTIAVNRSFSSQDGQKQADFINCVTFRNSAENLAKFQAKGNLIGVQGRIQTRSFQGKDGNTVYVMEVVADAIQYLQSKQSGDNQNGYGGQVFNNFSGQNNKNFNDYNPFKDDFNN